MQKPIQFLVLCAMGVVLLTLAETSLAAPRFDPNTECTSEDRGPYPWGYRQIVESYISQTFFDPSAVVDLEIFKPAPGWWTTANFRRTRKNTKCYWYVPFIANGKNRMGGYVGRKAHGLWIRAGIIVHSAERTGVDAPVIRAGEQSFTEELGKLSGSEREEALALSAEPVSSEPEGRCIPSYIDELRELAKLREDGIITDEEFGAKKAQILSSTSATASTGDGESQGGSLDG